MNDERSSAGAAGNFLATVENLSVNAFKSVVDIDLIGSFITAKVTLPHLVASALLWRGKALAHPAQNSALLALNEC